MNMNRSHYLMAAILLLVAGCRNNSFTKFKGGSEYKIIRNESGKKAVKGNYLQINQIIKYKDSTLLNSIEDSMPNFSAYDTAQLPPFFRDINEGDSLVIRTSTDTLFKIGRSAPFMKKNEYIYTYFKVTKVFTSREEAEKVAKTYEAAARAIGYRKEVKAKAEAYKKTIEQITKALTDSAAKVKKDDQIITDFIKKNNITATKTNWGTYVSIETPGTGENLTDTSIAVVNYTGRTLKDTVFDSNTDKKFGHPEPYDVDMSEFGVIAGWIDGLKLMKKGSKGKFIIPSILAYGSQGSGKIAPDENLVFDIEVKDVMTRAQYEAKQNELMQQQQMQRQIQQMQQQMQQQQQQNPNSQPPPPQQEKKK